MKKLKQLFKIYNIDGYIVPKNDEYFNEYVHSSKDKLRFISNFTGSAGFAIILKNKNYLFVDGRYTVQARNQSGKEFKVFTMPNKFPKNILKENKKIIIGFDPKLHTERQLKFTFKIKNIILKPIDRNLIDIIWTTKPKELLNPFYSLSAKNSGKNIKSKISMVKNILLKKNIDYLLITAPENIAWILNIRGHDNSNSPIPNARLLLSKKGKSILFANPKKTYKIKNSNFHIDDEKNLKWILNLISTKKIWLDSLSCSIYFKNLLKRKNKIIEQIDPIHFLKSIKNNTEIKNIKKSHIIDGLALTRFLFWLKKNFGKKKNYRNISSK